jgi:hypothetical protein
MQRVKHHFMLEHSLILGNPQRLGNCSKAETKVVLFCAPPAEKKYSKLFSIPPDYINTTTILNHTPNKSRHWDVK